MYKNILVPVALTNVSQVSVIQTAVDALADETSKITLIHVIEELPAYTTVHFSKDYLKHSKMEVGKQLDEIASNFPDAKSVVVHGHSSRDILAYAEANECDCIVVNSHKPGAQDYFLGGTAARIVRYAKCSVHVIR